MKNIFKIFISDVKRIFQNVVAGCGYHGTLCDSMPLCMV